MAIITCEGKETRVVGRAIPQEKRRPGVLGKIDGISFSEFKRMPPLERKELLIEAFKAKEDEAAWTTITIFTKRKRNLVKELAEELLNQRQFGKMVQIFKKYWPCEEAVDFAIGKANGLKNKQDTADLLVALVKGGLLEKAYEEEGTFFFIDKLDLIMNRLKEEGMKVPEDFDRAVARLLRRDINDCRIEYEVLGEIIESPWVNKQIKDAALKKLPAAINESCEDAKDCTEIAKFLAGAKNIPPQTMKRAITALLKADVEFEEIEKAFEILMASKNKQTQAIAMEVAIKHLEEYQMFNVIEVYIRTDNKEVKRAVEANLNTLLNKIRNALEVEPRNYIHDLWMFYVALANREKKDALPKLEAILAQVFNAAKKKGEVWLKEEVANAVKGLIDADVPENLKRQAVEAVGINIKQHQHPLTGEIDWDGIKSELNFY